MYTVRICVFFGRRVIKHGSVAMKRFPTELFSVSSDLGSVGLHDIGESITTQTVWFAQQMFWGKKDSEARALFPDTLEDIKQHQTFQAANVYQSSNRLDEVMHSHHKWCATRLYECNICDTDNQRCVTTAV